MLLKIITWHSSISLSAIFSVNLCSQLFVAIEMMLVIICISDYNFTTFFTFRSKFVRVMIE